MGVWVGVGAHAVTAPDAATVSRLSAAFASTPYAMFRSAPQQQRQSSAESSASPVPQWESLAQRERMVRARIMWAPASIACSCAPVYREEGQ